MFNNHQIAEVLGYGGKRPQDTIQAISRGRKNLPLAKLEKAQQLAASYNVRKTPLSPKQIKQTQKSLRKAPKVKALPKPDIVSREYPTYEVEDNDFWYVDKERDWEEVSESYFLGVVSADDEDKLITRLGMKNVHYYYWNPSLEIFWLTRQHREAQDITVRRISELLYEYEYTKSDGEEIVQYPFYTVANIIGRLPRPDETFASLLASIELYHVNVSEALENETRTRDEFYKTVLPMESRKRLLALVERA